MKVDEQYRGQDHRLQKILFLLKKRGRVSVSELGVLFGVSQVTVRADLSELERQGLVMRKYGGAALVPLASADNVTSPVENDGTHRSPDVESHAFARLAFGLIVRGDVVFLDSSEESGVLADLLKYSSELTVITTSLEYASMLARRPGIVVYLLGGRVSADDSTSFATVGDWPFPSLHLTKAFMAAWGATANEGFTDHRSEDASVKRAVISRAGASYIFLRSGRWGTKSLSTFATLDAVTAVITDADAPAAMSELLEKTRGIALIRASTPKSHYPAYNLFAVYRANADEGLTYEGSPGRGKRIAFANGKRAEHFCVRVEEGLLRNAVLAGFGSKDILVLDNDYNPDHALANTNEIIAWGADVVVMFNTDLRSNNQIAELFRKASIPVVSMDGSIPSAPFVGANNWRIGSLAGEYAKELIQSKLGGWDQVDGVLLVEMSAAGELVLFRTEAFAASLEAAWGDGVEEKIIRIEGGNQYDTARAVMSALAPSLKKDGRYVLSTINTEAMEGAVEALIMAGVWSPDRFVSISNGFAASVRDQMASGIVDASILLPAELYGSHAIPAACAVLSGAAVPPYVYVDVSLVLPDGAERRGS